jgi:hypothetical protein
MYRGVLSSILSNTKIELPLIFTYSYKTSLLWNIYLIHFSIMSKLLTILPNEIWYEIVAFFPLTNIVSTIQFEIKNEIELFKKFRFIKLKHWRNHLLRELLHLWCLACTCQERPEKSSNKHRDPINMEYAGIRKNVRQKIAELFKIISLPWIYQKCGVGVSYQRMHSHIKYHSKTNFKMDCLQNS